MGVPSIGLENGLELDPAVANELESLIASLRRAFFGLNNVVLGLGAGTRVAFGQATTTSAIHTVNTGLTTVVAAFAGLEDAPVIGCDRAQAVVGTQRGAPAAGRIYVKTFKPTAAGDATPIAATTFGKKVNYIAFGT